VHPHIHLSRRVSLWITGRRRRHSRRHYKSFVQHAANRRGLEQVRLRARKWAESSPHAAAGLATLEWKRIRRILGLGPWGEQILYRLKARAFSLYDVRNERQGCPHASCLHEADVDLFHVFWTCPAARQLRTVFVSPWTQLRLPGREIEAAVFGLELPIVPTALWEAVARHPALQSVRRAELDECVTALTEGCWRLGAALYFHGVWRWRVQHFDETNDVSKARHQLLLDNRLRQGYASMHLYVRPARGPSNPFCGRRHNSHRIAPAVGWLSPRREARQSDLSILTILRRRLEGQPRPRWIGSGSCPFNAIRRPVPTSVGGQHVLCCAHNYQ
jgi:hypothetical protein